MRFFILIIALQVMPLHAQPQKTSSSKPETWMKDQEDQTDTLAIPLDSSEEEERQELEALQKQK